MKNWFTTVCYVVLLVMPFSVLGQKEKTLRDEVSKQWKQFQISGKDTVQFFFDYGKNIKKYIDSKNSKDSGAIIENKIEIMLHVYHYYMKHKNDEVKHKDEINKLLGSIDIFSKEFMSTKSFMPRVNVYYALRAITNGAPIAQIVERINVDKYEYEKYKEILESGNTEFMLNYCGYLKMVFMYEGYIPALKQIKPLIEKYLPEGELKEELRERYANCERIEPGQPAPDFRMKDSNGKEWTLKDFRGKILVVDVWATWCSGCVAKLPYFLKLAEKYKDRDDVVFITITRDSDWDTWQAGLKRLNALSLTALFQSPTFGKDYNIPGIPLYMLIDENGKFICSKVPMNTLGEQLEGVEKILKETLEKRDSGKIL